jgi:MinD-like ATPase involved in chromosome partitioning or flagellar assembly
VDLPTYTNIWRIEKRLYKLYDLRLPMPLPLVQIGVFLGVFVPWIVLLKLVGIPFRGGWILPLYVVPPGILTWMATRPVIEGKRLTELLLSQSRYLVEPRTWCRLTPIREPREVVVVVKVWRRPSDATSSVAAAVRSDRKARKEERRRRGAPVRVTTHPAAMPGAGLGPAYVSAPQPLSAQLSALDATTAAPVTSVPAVYPEPQMPVQVPATHPAEREPAPTSARGQMTHRWPPPDPRDLAAERSPASQGRTESVPAPAAPAERPPVTPMLEQPPVMPVLEARTVQPPAQPPNGPLSGPQVRERATSSGAPAEPVTTPVSAQEQPAATDRVDPADTAEAPGSGKRALASGVRRPGAAAEFWKAIAPSEGAAVSDPATPDPAEPVVVEPGAAQRAESTPAQPEVVKPVDVTPEPAEPPKETAIPPAPTTRPDIPQVPAATRPDIPMVPGAFGTGGRGPAQTQPVAGSPAEQPAAERPPAEEAVAPSSETEQPQQQIRRPVPSPSAEHVPSSGPGPQAPGAGPEPQVPGTGPPEHAEDGPPPWSKSLARPMQEGQTDALIWPPPGHKTGSSKHRKIAPEAPAAQAGPPLAQSPEVAPPETPAEVTQAEMKPAAASPSVPPSAAPPPGRPGPVGEPLPPVQPAAAAYEPSSGERKAPPAQDRRTWPAQPPVRGIPPRPQGTPIKPPPPSVVPEVRQPNTRPQPAPPPRAVPAAEVQPSPAREVRSGPASPVRPRPRPLIPPTPPPPPAATITPPDMDQEGTAGGLRRLIQAVGGGHNELDAEYEERLQRPFQGTRHIVVLGCTGGAGQTVTALMLGHTFAQYCGEPIVAVDVNPGPGALARRTRSETPETLTGLIARADQVHSLTAMRRYTSQAKSGLDVIAAGKNPLQALDDRDYALAIRTLDRFYSVTMLDAAAAVVARVLPHADQIVLVAPASADAPRAVGMTFEWLDGHGYDELRSRAVTVINGVSRRSMDDVEQAEAVARGQCRALVRIPWDDHLSLDRSPRNELKALRAPTRRAYLALAGVVAGGFTALPERYQEHEQEVGR